MTFTQLRLKHPRMIYRSYAMRAREGTLSLSFDFFLEPDIPFHPHIEIPYSGEFDTAAFAPFAFHLGLIEAMSYWKAACPAEFVVEAGSLSAAQMRFWQDLYVHGLGEFYYRNIIDFTQEDFLKITSRGDKGTKGAMGTMGENGDLVLVGGGKDSAVTLALLKNRNVPFQTMVLNPTQASLVNIKAAGLPEPLVVTRSIDPKLLELNKEGYLNGHTPFSAYLAFLGVAVAALNGNTSVVVSNERSANEGNVVYHGVEINHQYSKSFRFEELFRAYVRDFLTPDVSYFSFLRPLNDLQISKLFSGHPEFFTTFRSCNVGSRTNSWCGECAKCAFTYMSLFPWMSPDQMVISFGSDLLLSSSITGHIRALVGLESVKPFDCVGTRDEAVLALYLSIAKYTSEKREVPEGLLKIKSDLGRTGADIVSLKQSVLERWGDTYNLPEEYLSLLKLAWQTK